VAGLTLATGKRNLTAAVGCVPRTAPCISKALPALRPGTGQLNPLPLASLEVRIRCKAVCMCNGLCNALDTWMCPVFCERPEGRGPRRYVDYLR